MKIDPELIIPDKRLSINKGGLKASGWAMEGSTIAAMYMKGLAEHYHFSLDTPLGAAGGDHRHPPVRHQGEKIRLRRESEYGSGSFQRPLRGHQQPGAPLPGDLFLLDQGGDRGHMSAVPCDECHGQRLSPRAWR